MTHGSHLFFMHVCTPVTPGRSGAGPFLEVILGDSHWATHLPLPVH